MHIHKPMYVGQLYAYAYFEPVCAYRIMHAQTCPKNPTQKLKTKNRVETKTKETINLTYFKT